VDTWLKEHAELLVPELCWCTMDRVSPNDTPTKNPHCQPEAPMNEQQPSHGVDQSEHAKNCIHMLQTSAIANPEAALDQQNLVEQAAAAAAIPNVSPEQLQAEAATAAKSQIPEAITSILAAELAVSIPDRDLRTAIHLLKVSTWQ